LVTKKIILLLIVLSVINLGCLSSEDEEKNKREDREAGGSSGGAQRPREVKTPIGIHGETWTQKETETEGEMWTQEETQSQKELETPTETETETETQGEVETPEETGISKIEKEPGIRQTEEGKRADTAQPTGIAQPNETTATTHLVRLKDYLMIPSSLKINVGDTVVWRNYQESSVLIQGASFRGSKACIWRYPEAHIQGIRKLQFQCKRISKNANDHHCKIRPQSIAVSNDT
jgi:plastocyanin